MQGFSLGAGLAALAFWGFIAAVVVAGVWSDIRKREAQQETVRRLIESGQKVDEEVLERLLGKDKSERLDRNFKLVAMIMLPVALGLAAFALVLGMQAPDAKLPLLGVSVLVAVIGLGFGAASRVARRWYESSDESEVGRI